ncbi:MAG: DMT family transporter [Burkholderiales bacterium]|nr:DMT family transporter [Burkholderiales bacterium]
MFKKHPLLQMIISVASLASIGIFIHKSQLEPIATGFYRCLFGIVFLLIINKFTAHRIVNDNIVTKMSNKKSSIITLIAGICLGMDMLVWNLSFKYTTMAETNLIVNITPLLIFPITIFYFKEKFSALVIVPFALAIFGLYLLVFATGSTQNLHLTGDIMAFIAAIFYAGFVVLTKVIANSGINMGRYMVKISTYCAILLLIAGIISGENFFPHDVHGWILLIALAFISIVCGQYFLAQAMTKIPLQISSVFLLLQPVFAALYGITLFDEKLSIGQTIGAVTVLVAVFIFKQIEIRYNKKAV